MSKEIDWKDMCMRVLYSVYRSEGVDFGPWMNVSDDFYKKVIEHYDEWFENVGKIEQEEILKECRLKYPDLYEGK